MVNQILSAFPAADAAEVGRRRQAAVWRGEEPDYLPILMGGAVPGAEGMPRYTLGEQFRDPEKMLVGQLLGALGAACGRSDAAPSFRVSFGCGFLPTLLGLEQRVFEDQMPWLVEHCPKEVLARLSPDEVDGVVRAGGLMPECLSRYARFRQAVGNRVALFVADTQGPFDLAHLLRGEDLFYDLYDDPGFVHHLMRIATRLYIGGTRVMKQALGEPDEAGHHSGMLRMENGGVRLCADTDTLLSREQFREFSLPYVPEALAAFGGGWVHFCGSAHQWLDDLLEVPEVRGINFGNPERYDPDDVLGKLVARGKLFFGGFPQRPGEALDDYFRRLLGCLGGRRRGLILLPMGNGSPEWREPERVVERWRAIQDEMLAPAGAPQGAVP